MAQKSYHKREGDIEVMSEDGQTMYVFRENGNRLTIDLAETDKEDEAGETAVYDLGDEHDLRPATALSYDVVDEDSGLVVPDDTKPLWMDEARPLLDQLDGSTPNNRTDVDLKKKMTILAMAEAEYTGISKVQVFKQPDTCSRQVYYKKWRKDPLFSVVLNEVISIAQRAKTDEQMRSIDTAVNKIRGAAPEAADRHIELMRNPNPFVALQASAKILSMASADTASKDGGVTISLDATQLANAASLAQEELEQWQQEQQASQVIEPESGPAIEPESSSDS